MIHIRYTHNVVAAKSVSELWDGDRFISRHLRQAEAISAKLAYEKAHPQKKLSPIQPKKKTIQTSTDKQSPTNQTDMNTKMTRDIDATKADTKDLLAWYNENSGSKPIKKFSDEVTARARVAELKQALTELAGGASKPTKESKKAAAKEAKAPKASAATKKAEKAAGKPAKGTKKEEASEEEAGRGRNSAFTGKRIYRSSKENPRRPESFGWHSYNCITDGMTYEEYVKAGGRNVDLRYDLQKGFVKLK